MINWISNTAKNRSKGRLLSLLLSLTIGHMVSQMFTVKAPTSIKETVKSDDDAGFLVKQASLQLNEPKEGDGGTLTSAPQKTG